MAVEPGTRSRLAAACAHLTDGCSPADIAACQQTLSLTASTSTNGGCTYSRAPVAPVPTALERSCGLFWASPFSLFCDNGGSRLRLSLDPYEKVHVGEERPGSYRRDRRERDCCSWRACASWGGAADMPLAPSDLSSGAALSASPADALLWALDRVPGGVEAAAAEIEGWLLGLSMGGALLQWSRAWEDGTACSVLSSYLSGVNEGGVDAAAEAVSMLSAHDAPLTSVIGLLKDVHEGGLGRCGATGVVMLDQGLMLAEAVDHLASVSAALPRLGHAPCVPCAHGAWNPEQEAAIMASGPLTIVRAGAGCGKSTVLGARVSQLEAGGADPSEVCVLSFTNAAADHAGSVAPGTLSSTLDSWIVEQHRLLHPRSQVVSAQTMAWRLAIGRGALDGSGDRLASLVEGAPGDDRTMAALVAFCRDRYADVVGAVDGLGQVSLELACALCIVEMDMSRPLDAGAPRHLLVDEVQDNSLCQFLFICSYAASRGCSLFIVGDPSQTLYEFRGADPGALDLLEASGAFEVLPLTYNYRSAQRVLDVANGGLGSIKAQTSSDRTLKSALPGQQRGDGTEVSACHVQVPSDSRANITRAVGEALFDHGLAQWVADNKRDGLTTCFLAPRRSDVATFEEVLPQAVPGVSVAEIMAERDWSDDALSSFVEEASGTLSGVPLPRLLDAVPAAVTAHARARKDWVSRDYEAWLASALDEWRDSCDDVQDVVEAACEGEATREEAVAAVLSSLLSFEASHDAVAKSVERGKGPDVAALCAANDVVCSTVHSAKGLEFDAVAVLVPADAPRQDQLRLQYVALTRAKRREFVVSYGPGASSELVDSVLGL